MAYGSEFFDNSQVRIETDCGGGVLSWHSHDQGVLVPETLTSYGIRWHLFLVHWGFSQPSQASLTALWGTLDPNPMVMYMYIHWWFQWCSFSPFGGPSWSKTQIIWPIVADNISISQLQHLIILLENDVYVCLSLIQLNLVKSNQSEWEAESESEPQSKSNLI